MLANQPASPPRAGHWCQFILEQTCLVPPHLQAADVGTKCQHSLVENHRIRPRAQDIGRAAGRRQIASGRRSLLSACDISHQAQPLSPLLQPAPTRQQAGVVGQ